MASFTCRRHAASLVRIADPKRRLACPVGEQPDDPCLPQPCAVSWIPEISEVTANPDGSVTAEFIIDEG